MNFLVDRTMPSDMICELSKLGTVYKSAYIDFADKAVTTHPDLQIHFLDDKLAVCAQEVYSYYKKILPADVELLKGRAALGCTYPDNCAYNIARVGKNVICNTKFADKLILEIYKERVYNIIHVNQGYTKCNVCPISDSIILTEDKGIYNVLKSTSGIEPILLKNNSANLEGFEYGFIGGASGKCYDTILFCGKINCEIFSILQEKNVNFVQLSNSELYDYGSILSFG